jgi:hypothetical protein
MRRAYVEAPPGEKWPVGADLVGLDHPGRQGKAAAVAAAPSVSHGPAAPTSITPPPSRASPSSEKRSIIEKD